MTVKERLSTEERSSLSHQRELMAEMPKRPNLGNELAAAAVVLVIGLALLSLILPLEKIEKFFSIVTGVATAVIAAIGVYAVLGRMRIADKQAKTAEQGQVTERFSRAIEHLGAGDRLTVRLGGIYALERIAGDSSPDYDTVMEVLCSFVRERLAQFVAEFELDRERAYQVDATGEGDEIPPLPADIQAALTVIGRCLPKPPRARKLDLRNLQLLHAKLRGDFRGADFRQTDFLKADLSGADLRGADLRWATNLHKLPCATGDETTKLSGNWQMPDEWKRQNGGSQSG